MNDLPNDIKFLVFDYLHPQVTYDIKPHKYSDSLLNAYSSIYGALFFDRTTSGQNGIQLVRFGNSKRKLKMLWMNTLFKDIDTQIRFRPELLSSLSSITALNINCGFDRLPLMNLKKLKILRWQSSEVRIPDSYTNLTELYCQGSLNLPDNLINLTKLDCSHRYISGIPNTYINLTELNCNSSNITEIPKELVNLTSLMCFFCPIREIPKELVNLTVLSCSMCDYITEIPKELTKLEYLSCGYCNNLLKIPKELSNLTYLDCYCCLKLRELNMVNLKMLSCHDCKNLVKLPPNMAQINRYTETCQQIENKFNFPKDDLYYLWQTKPNMCGFDDMFFNRTRLT